MHTATCATALEPELLQDADAARGVCALESSSFKLVTSQNNIKGPW